MRDARSSPPYALALSLLLIIAFEIWFRSWPIERRVAYRDESDQGVAVRNQIDAGPMPEVAIVGSSMAYQGIAVPELAARLTDERGRPVSVGNFAVRGGRVDLAEAVVREILRQPTKPKVIVVGIAMRDMREYGLAYDQLANFWTLGEWRHETRLAKGSWLTDQLPQVVRNEVGRYWQTLRCRTAVSLAAQSLFIDTPLEPMPARGGRPTQHEGSRAEKSLANDLKLFSTKSMKRLMLRTYRPELPATPPHLLSDRVGKIITACDRAQVRLIFVDMPLSRPLRDLLDNAQKASKNRDASKDFDIAYHKVMNAWARRGKVPFVQWDHRRIAWSNELFFDAQHLNLAGAIRMSTAISGLIAEELGVKHEQPATTQAAE